MNEETLRLELAPLLGERLVAMTEHADSATGGTAVPVRRAAFAEIHVEILHRGRALAVRMEAGGAWLTVVSIHNLGMSVAEVNAVARRIRGIG